MRKCISLLPLLLLLIGARAFAQEQAEYFPLDQGMVWAFDDGNIDRIVAFKQMMPGNPIQLFAFEPYNFASRLFFRDGLKVYEYNNGYRRLWYDFGTKPGVTWKMAWEKAPMGGVGEGIPIPLPPDGVTTMNKKMDKIAGNGMGNGMGPGSEDPAVPPQSDLNEGAEMTLVANDEKVAVPYGEFERVCHFQMKRPGVADAGYVDEWFAMKIGCVQRVWDTIAGPHQQKLAKIAYPQPESPLRMDVALDKDSYLPGEDIQITVSVLNWSDNDVTLNFPNSLQMDYIIDDVFAYSKMHPVFTDATTQVTIPAREVHKWTITHPAADYAPPVGSHSILTYLAGTDLRAEQKFRVTSGLPALPEGVSLTVKTDKDQYTTGEPVTFTLTLSNRNEGEASVTVMPAAPVVYTVGQDYVVPEQPEIKPAVSEVKIPGRGSIQYTVEITADQAALEPGYYVLVAALRGYDDTVYTKFIVLPQMTLGTISGTVFSMPESDGLTPAPIPNADVSLTSAFPKNYERDMSIFPGYEKVSFSARTDENGNFTLTDVPVGVFYTLTVQAQGYTPYVETVRTLEQDTALKVQLRPYLFVEENNLNYRKRLIDGLTIVMGADQTVYKPDSPFKASWTIYNTRSETVSFTFDGDLGVTWYLETPNGIVALSQDETESKSSVQSLLELKPGDSRQFTRVSTFKGKVPDNGGKYAILAKFAFTSCSLSELNPGNLDDFIKVLVTPSSSNRMDAAGHNKEMVVDCRSGQNAVINITTRNDNAKGEVAVSEVLANYHSNRPSQRFIKMIEVDADSSIRADMDSALVRIYYDPSGFGEGFKPESLIISHWDDKLDNPGWIDLPTRVDTLNNCVEAYTASFSSFGLFQMDAGTSVDESVPKTFSLAQNTPNPFNPSTVIRFQVPVAGQVRLSVYNVTGQEVAQLVNGFLAAGEHEAVFSGNGLASGVYFYSMQAKGFTQARKMLMIK